LHSCVVDTVENVDDLFSNLPNSPSFHVVFDDNGVCVPKWMGKKYLQDSVHLNSVLLAWIQCSKNKQSIFFEIDDFHVHLEYIWNGITFWCHPNYKSKGEWNDWVMVQFDMGNHKDYCGKKPIGMCQIIIFQVKWCVSWLFLMMTQHMLLYIQQMSTITKVILFYLKDGNLKLL